MSAIVPHFLRRPTEAAAMRRTPPRPAPAAPVPELRTRLCRAVAADDGHGALMLACLIARAA